MRAASQWFRQAERDLEQAQDSRRAGRNEWACFAAHQAAEKAAKVFTALLTVSSGERTELSDITQLVQEAAV